MTRTLLSLTAPSGRPTTLKYGRPIDMSTSTSTTTASTPISAPDRARASLLIRLLLVGERHSKHDAGTRRAWRVGDRRAGATVRPALGRAGAGGSAGKRLSRH